MINIYHDICYSRVLFIQDCSSIRNHARVICFPMERYIKLQQYNYSVFPSCPDHAQHFPVVQPLTLPLNSCFFLQCSGDCLVKNKRFQSLKDYSLLLLLYNVIFFLLVMSCLYCFDGVTCMKLIFAPS